MDRIIERINQEKKNIIANYKENWDKMISAWNKDGNTNSFWLSFSASYLFKTENVRWALDPVSLFNRIKYEHERDFAKDLKKLSFVVLSHDHIDHCDLKLIDALSSLSIKVIISEQLFPIILNNTGMKRERLIILKDNESINICGINITAFDGFHDSKAIKVPANSYLIDSGKHRMFFPGDVREYNKNALPLISPIDFYFSHLWLGTESALLEEYELLKPFCEFSVKLKPKKIFITHLFEVGRNAENYWNQQHAQRVKNYLLNHYPEFEVEIPQFCREVLL